MKIKKSVDRRQVEVLEGIKARLDVISLALMLMAGMSVSIAISNWF
ncbi:hypothetical protein [Marinobacter nauticus]|nr:hypothetical protein [Marinobacter nauticus]